MNQRKGNGKMHHEVREGLLWPGVMLSVLLVVSLMVGGCAEKKPPPDIYWPTPPDAPRVKFVKAIHSSRDVKKTGFFEKVKEMIVGASAAQGMGKPFGVFAKGDRVYVTDSIMRTVQVYNFKENSFHMIGTSGEGRLIKPMALTVGDSGNIYVADSSAKRVLVYDKNFTFLQAIGKKGVLGRPIGIAVNEKREMLYVTDIVNHRVQVFDLKGNDIFTFGQRGIEDGEFNYPTSMALSKEGDIFIVDSMNFRVQRFDPEGKFKDKFGQAGDMYGMFAKPKGISIDSEGHLYVTDAAFNNIQIFDQEGKILLFFSNMGYKRGELWMPSGIGINEKDEIYVADQYNHRVNVYKYLTEEEGKKILAEKQPQ